MTLNFDGSLVLCLSSSLSFSFSSSLSDHLPPPFSPRRSDIRAGTKLDWGSAGAGESLLRLPASRCFLFRQHVELSNQNTGSWLQGAGEMKTRPVPAFHEKRQKGTMTYSGKLSKMTVPRIWKKEKDKNDTLSLNYVQSLWSRMEEASVVTARVTRGRLRVSTCSQPGPWFLPLLECQSFNH